jgi:uncharacterized protein
VSAVSVARLSITPIKGLRVYDTDSIELGRAGARGDRAFYLVDGNDRMVNGKQHGGLQEITASLEATNGHPGALRVTFPDGRSVVDEVALGASLNAAFFSRETVGRLVEGPWSQAISEHVGAPLRLVAAVPDDYRGSAVDRGFRGAASLISSAALERLAEVGGVSAVDGRRFRMLIEVDGLEAHAEDRWVGHTVQLGDARILFHGHVGRCVVTTRNAETGVVDFPTLKLLAPYRRSPEFTEEVCFGIHGEVVQPGAVRIGDTVTLADG